MASPAGPPPIPLQLLEYLEKVYAPRMPKEDESDRSLWMRTGQVELVQTLRAHYAKQHQATNIVGV